MNPKLCRIAALLAALSALPLGANAAFTYRAYAEGLVAAPVAPVVPKQAPVSLGVLTPDSSVDFGSTPRNTAVTRTFTLSNTGSAASGSLATTLSAYNGLSITSNSCTGTLPAGDSCAIAVKWQPTLSGSLSGASLDVSGFTTPLQPLYLSGAVTGFNVTSAWSSEGKTVTAPTPSYGTVTRGALLDKLIVLRNTGTSGNLSAGFSLSGDVSQFKIVSVATLYDTTSTTAQTPCLSGGAISGSSSTPCFAADTADGPYAYDHVRLMLRYAPTATGSHSVTVTPATANGSGLPSPLTLTGMSAFNPKGVWSSVNSSTAGLTGFGAVTQGSYADKYIFLRNTGTNGALAVNFTLSGDVSQFKVVGLATATDSGSIYNQIPCVSGGSFTTDSTSACLAADPAEGYYSYRHLRLMLRYAPTVAGSHSITIVPSSSNGSDLPETLTLTGSSN